MDHVAILDTKRKLLAKIISGEKTIESRWYKFKKTPYQNIAIGDVVYFKESGKPVSVRSKVAKTIFIDKLSPEKINYILNQYASQLGVSLSYAEHCAGKNFCTLIFLKQVEPIEPFHIDKKGYGAMAAWITLEDIKKIKR